MRIAVLFVAASVLFATAACRGGDDGTPLTADEVATLQARIEQSRFVATYDLIGDGADDEGVAQTATLAKDRDLFLASLNFSDDTTAYARGRFSTPDDITNCVIAKPTRTETVCVISESAWWALTFAPVLAPFGLVDAEVVPGSTGQRWSFEENREIAGVSGNCFTARLGELCVAHDGVLLSWMPEDGEIGVRMRSRDVLADPAKLRVPYRIVTEAELDAAR